MHNFGLIIETSSLAFGKSLEKVHQKTETIEKKADFHFYDYLKNAQKKVQGHPTVCVPKLILDMKV